MILFMVLYDMFNDNMCDGNSLLGCDGIMHDNSNHAMFHELYIMCLCQNGQVYAESIRRE